MLSPGREQRPRSGKKPPAHPRRRGLKRRGSFQVDKPPLIGFVERRGKADLMVVCHGKRPTVVHATPQLLARGSRGSTDDYRSYTGLAQTGYRHHPIQPSRGEDARGRVHTHTIEGGWSRFKTWMRRHRGVSKRYLPGYAATFEFFYTHRHLLPIHQGKRLLALCLKAPGPDLRKLIRTGRFITLCSP